MKRFVIGLVLAGSTSATPTDLSGAWTLKMDRDFRGNPGAPVECTFRQQSTQLVVKCGTSRAGELKGEVRRGKVTWGFEKTGLPPLFEDRLVLSYSGEMNVFGTRVKGTWRLTSSVLDETGTFEASRRQ